MPFGLPLTAPAPVPDLVRVRRRRLVGPAVGSTTLTETVRAPVIVTVQRFSLVLSQPVQPSNVLGDTICGSISISVPSGYSDAHFLVSFFPMSRHWNSETVPLPVVSIVSGTLTSRLK